MFDFRPATGAGDDRAVSKKHQKVLVPKHRLLSRKQSTVCTCFILKIAKKTFQNGNGQKFKFHWRSPLNSKIPKLFLGNFGDGKVVLVTHFIPTIFVFLKAQI